MGKKVEIVEHLYPSQQWYSFKIKAHNPWGRIFHKFNKIAFHVLEISASKFYEDYLMIDDSFVPKGETKIGYRWHFRYKKPWDEYTKFIIYVKLNGNQDKKTNEGEVEFKFMPYLETKFPYANSVQKALIDLYWYIYYRKRHYNLIMQSKALFEKLVAEIRTEWGVNPMDERLKEAWKESF